MPHFASPVTIGLSTAATTADVAAAIAGGVDANIPIGALGRAEWGIYPAPGGHLTTDGGIVAGDPTTTGLRFVTWDEFDRFNYQGMNPVEAPANILTQTGSVSVMGNRNTPRDHNGTTGQFINGCSDFRFITDSAVVIPAWYTSATHTASNNFDMHMLVSDGGEMKHLSNGSGNNGLPRTSSAGADFYHRRLDFDRRLTKEHRVILGGASYFEGVWIDEHATIKRAPNKPVVLMVNGDSWSDSAAAGSTWQSGAGFSWPSGSYQTLNMATMLSFHLGLPVGSTAQGGTGEEEENGTSGGTATDYAGNRSSAMWTDSRVNHQIDTFGPQYFVEVSIGSWNDGPGGAMTTPYDDTYRDRMDARYDKMIARSINQGRAGTDIKMITVSVQPVVNAGEGSAVDAKDLQAQGQAEIPALFPNNCLGHVPIRFAGEMWDDRSTTGPRSIYTLSDNLHLAVQGFESVTAYIAAAIAPMTVPTSLIVKTMSAEVGA